MLPVEWKLAARLDLIEIIDYIAQENPQAAEKMKRLLDEAAERLGEMPYINRRGRVAGTREKIAHRNYIIVYRVAADKVEILNIVHSRKNYPNSPLFSSNLRRSPDSFWRAAAFSVRFKASGRLAPNTLAILLG